MCLLACQDVAGCRCQNKCTSPPEFRFRRLGRKRGLLLEDWRGRKLRHVPVACWTMLIKHFFYPFRRPCLAIKQHCCLVCASCALSYEAKGCLRASMHQFGRHGRCDIGLVAGRLIRIMFDKYSTSRAIHFFAPTMHTFVLLGPDERPTCSSGPRPGVDFSGRCWDCLAHTSSGQGGLSLFFCVRPGC
ncbi:hypothetical protein EV356DRAFT_207349 [Viridothelium virens]|uniref:Uncharacterized protein n=1 Tax=Viridothelium virens TaxID=1048519 RepID=A0A6A6H5T3_VIRVR|nr:hypothetical protein EV356DRAFT_207349 [Viridothelium virens]